MTDRSKLLALAEAVEKLTGPDRRTDYLVMTATVRPGHAYLWDPNDSNHRYTASLDHAMTLADPQWDCGTVWDRDERGAVVAFGPNALAGFPLGQGKACALTMTVALALAATAAALRAQAEALA